MKLITEDTQVDYKSNDELSYFDFDEETVSLYINKQFEGDVKVWKDSEMKGREYICINYEIIYLDSIKRM